MEENLYPICCDPDGSLLPIATRDLTVGIDGVEDL